MREHKRLRQLGDLVALHRHERASAEAEVYKASRSRDRAEEIGVLARAGRDDAAQAWQSNLEGPRYDFMLAQIRAQNLLDCERNLDQCEALVRLAEDRLTDHKSVWQHKDLRVRISEKVEHKMKRKFRRKLDEKELAEVGDRISFRSAKHGH